MAKCKYCGRDAGFLSSSHKECAALATQTMTYFTDLALHVLRHGGLKEEVKQALEKAARDANLNSAQQEQAALDAVASSLELVLEDGIVTPEEESHLLTVVNAVNLPMARIQQLPVWSQMIKSLVLADILNGVVPTRCTSNLLHIVLQKGESVIWVFNGVQLHEMRTKRGYVGGSVGVSVRVMKGVYLRTSSFRGHPVETTHAVHLGMGSFIITNKHVFFQGPAGVVKMAVKKIVAVEPYTDGIMIQLDGVSAKPRIFEGLDGLFAYNVITNLNLL
jgi:hypothetical protein